MTLNLQSNTLLILESFTPCAVHSNHHFLSLVILLLPFHVQRPMSDSMPRTSNTSKINILRHINAVLKGCHDQFLAAVIWDSTSADYQVQARLPGAYRLEEERDGQSKSSKKSYLSNCILLLVYVYSFNA